MTERDVETVRLRIRALVAAGGFRITRHAQEEMVEEAISLDDVVEALMNGAIIEDYPDHWRGQCCLVSGSSSAGRWLHVVCSTEDPAVIVITAYEPQPPRWLSPTQRAPR